MVAARLLGGAGGAGIQPAGLVPQALSILLDNPHPEGAKLAERGLDEWSRSLPDENAEALVDSSAGKAVRWILGEGWVEDGK